MTPTIGAPVSLTELGKRKLDRFPELPAASRILIIDDDVQVAASLTRLLLRAGIGEVEATSDPACGVALFRERPADLVLLDLNMPGMDGFDVLEQLQPLTSQEIAVPVIMLTGHGDTQQKRQALAMGASDFLLKPPDIMEVMLRVRSLLETRELQRQLANQNRTLEAAVARRTAELEATQLEMLERLAVAAELHDDETGQHTQRVGRMAGRLALALGLAPAQADLIARAAPLHDLGKIGISDAIIRKPGKLNEEESEVMRTHAATGARILAGGHSELIQMAERIARHHHERWDGSGYPDRLAGTAIPLEARIVAVADFFDALTNERPYRSAVPEARTLEIIRASSGTHFDPAVASAFLRLKDDGPVIAGEAA